MPAISMFYGIIIYMYYFDNKGHNKPHIHAQYADEEVIVSIPECEVLNGSLANNKMKLLKAWVEIHQEELLADWKLAIEGNKLFNIDPLK